MDIENEKISGRQFGRITFFDYFGVSSLILPGILAKTGAGGGMLALLLGSLAGYVLLLFIAGFFMQDGTAYGKSMNRWLGSVGVGIVCLIYLAASLFGAAYGLQLSGRIIYGYLGRTLPIRLMLALLTCLAVYGVCGGVESRGRMYELLTVLIVIPIVLLLILASFDVCPDNWLESETFQPGGLLRTSYIVFAASMGSVGIPMFSDSISDKAKGLCAWKRAYGWNTLMNLVLFLLLAGIFQIPTLRKLDMPALILTSLVKVPGEFLERQDALLSGVWLIAMFVFIENRIFEAGWCLLQLSGQSRTHQKQKKSCFVTVGIVAWLTGCGMYLRSSFAGWLTNAYLYVVVPLLVLMVVVMACMRKRKSRGRNKMAACCLMMCMGSLLTGCGQSQIEDRAYPLALAVKPEKNGLYAFTFSFEDVNPSEQGLYHNEDATVVAEGYLQAFYRFQSMQASVLDDSHLQALLLSKELLTDEGFWDSFYHFFVKEHHFSWNTAVYLTDDGTPEPEELKEHTGGRLGTYLYAMASSDTQQKTSQVPTLGDLYKDWNNRSDTLLLPVLGKRDTPEVSEYVLLYASGPVGTISVDEARLFALYHGQLNEFLFRPEPGEETILQLSHIRLTRCLSEPLARRGIWEVTLQADVTAANRFLYETKKKEHLQQAAGERLLLLLRDMEKKTADMGVVEKVPSRMVSVKLNYIE